MGLIPQDDIAHGCWRYLSNSEDNSTTDTARRTKFESNESLHSCCFATLLSLIGQSSFLLSRKAFFILCYQKAPLTNRGFWILSIQCTV